MHVRPTRPTDPLRATRRSVVLALVVGVVSIGGTLAVTRQLVGIGADARAIASGFIARSSALADVEEAARRFRSFEAHRALATSDSTRRARTASLDSIARGVDSLLALLAARAPTDAERASVAALAAAWRAYERRDAVARALPGGEGSPALAAFREREQAHAALLARARAMQGTLRDDAGRVAGRSSHTTTVAAGLLAGTVVATLALLALGFAVHRSARAQAEADARWRSITEQGLGLVWELDDGGRVRFASDAAARTLGRDAAAVVGRRALALVHPDDRRPLLDAARRAARDDTPIRDVETRVLRADGSVAWLAIEAFVLRTVDGDADGVRGVAVDITRRMQAEEALEQGRRLEALGTLAGGVAHDLNNVLAAILGYAQLGRAEAAALSPALADDLAQVEAAAGRGATLVRRILQFARRQPVERVPVTVATMVGEVVALLRPQLPPDVTIDATIEASDAEVLADPAELHQVVVNLCANAVHAMRRGGGTLHVTLRACPAHVQLVVRDEGEGMSEAVRARALEPFFTTRAPGEGTGMGLSVVHGVVRALGGTVTLESREREGTTATVTLPRHRATPTPVAPVAPVAAAVSPRRVLLVDDEPLVLRTLQRVLEQAGHAVEPHGSATAALRALLARPGRVDVVVTDLTMPGMSGLELVEAARRAGLRTPVLLLSGYLDDDAAARAATFGDVRSLDKPVAVPELLEAVAGAGATMALAG